MISPGPSIGNATCHFIALLMNTQLVNYLHTRPHGVTTKRLVSEHGLRLKLKKCYIFGLKQIDELNAVINTLRTGSFRLFKRPFPGFLTILTL